MSVCQMCGAELPDSATAGRKYCAACIKKRRSQQNHDAWERGKEKREAIKATVSHPCKRCGEQIYGNMHIRYCPECKKTVLEEQKKMQREAAKKRSKQKTELRRMQGHPCWICGDLMYNDLHVRYCSECAKIAKKENILKNKEKAMEAIEGIKEVQRIREQRALDASYKCKAKRFSMQFTFDELTRLAKQYRTSYGKFYAWINEHRRLPEKGEVMF